MLLFFVRLQSLGGILQPRIITGTMSVTEVLADVRGLDAVWRRLMHIEIGAAVVAAACGGVRLWVAPGLPIEIGSALMAAGVLFVVLFLHRRARVQPIPRGLGFAQLLALYTASLERRSELSRSFLWWYVLPLSLGPTVLAVGQAIQQPYPMPAIIRNLAAIVMIGMLLVLLARSNAHTFQQRIAQLATVSERQ